MNPCVFCFSPLDQTIEDRVHSLFDSLFNVKESLKKLKLSSILSKFFLCCHGLKNWRLNCSDCFEPDEKTLPDYIDDRSL